jgi:hypothetical protein
MVTPLEAALRYAAWGWPVLPCHEPVRGHCSCGRADCSSPAKHPRTRRGLHDATTDPAQLTDWWQRWPTANVAVRTGADSGIIVLDIDRHRGGIATLAALERKHSPLPPTATVETGAGRHYWFAHPGCLVPNSAGRLGPGIDIRADGGYIIAAPSTHITGRRYLWTALRSIAPLPDWIIERTPEPIALPVLQRQPSAPGRPWAQAALTGETTRVRSCAPGSRNHTLNRAAFALGQIVAAGYLAHDTVRQELTGAALQAGLTPREISATLNSGLHAGMRLPRHPTTPDINPR